MSRAKTTGRFESREELEETIIERWLHTKCKMSDIARFCRVSATTVSKVIDYHAKYRKLPHEDD